MAFGFAAVIISLCTISGAYLSRRSQMPGQTEKWKSFYSFLRSSFSTSMGWSIYNMIEETCNCIMPDVSAEIWFRFLAVIVLSASGLILFHGLDSPACRCLKLSELETVSWTNEWRECTRSYLTSASFLLPSLAVTDFVYHASLALANNSSYGAGFSLLVVALLHSLATPKITQRCCTMGITGVSPC